MPSRLGIAAIVVFWLVSASWLTTREIVPLFRAGAPPAFFTDVIDEVRGTAVDWRLLRKGQPAGSGISQVRPRPDRTFDLSTELRFNDFKVFKKVEIKKIGSRYRVGRDGSLMEMDLEIRVGSPDGELKGEVKSIVRGALLELTPRLYFNREEAIALAPMTIPVPAGVLNTMHPLNRIPGLRVGQSWKVRLFDPGDLLPGNTIAPKMLIAEVFADSLDWQGAAVDCLRADYSEPGQKASARTWVRRSDGLVLQQEAMRGEMDLVLVREGNK